MPNYANNACGEKDRRAAIVCLHVALGHLPILRAVRDDPTVPEDSGWQFRCAAVEDVDEPNMARVWAVYEVLEYEPSLADFIERPPGTVLTRKHPMSEWEVSLK